MTTLLALYRRPDGGDQALAGFFRATEDVARQRAEAAHGATTSHRAVRSTGTAMVAGNPLAGGPPDGDGPDRDWIAASPEQHPIPEETR